MAKKKKKMVMALKNMMKMEMKIHYSQSPLLDLCARKQERVQESKKRVRRRSRQ